jgi:hypothetical protein
MKTTIQQRSKRDVQLAAVCVLGTIVSWRFIDYLGPTEFRGGTVTRPMFLLLTLALDLYPLAAFLAFFYPPLAAGIALLAGVIALPIYLLFLFPHPFQQLLPGAWSVIATSNFNLDPWSLIGIVTIAAVVFLSIRIFRSAR